MAEKPFLDILLLEWSSQEGVAPQEDLGLAHGPRFGVESYLSSSTIISKIQAVKGELTGNWRHVGKLADPQCRVHCPLLEELGFYHQG
jgi:hypothetical protein